MSEKKWTTQEYEQLAGSMNNFGRSLVDFDRALLNTAIVSEATQELLIKKGVITLDELREEAERLFAEADKKIRESQEKVLKEAAESAVESVAPQEETAETEQSPE